MRVLRSKRAIVLAAVALVAVGVTAAVALAVLPANFDTKDVRLVIRHSEANGLDSKWHTHAGPVIVQVREGSFKIYQGSCTPTVVGPGETYIEIPELPVRAIANGHIIWTTSLILPNSSVGDPVGTTLVSGSDPYGCPQLGPNP